MQIADIDRDGFGNSQQAIAHQPYERRITETRYALVHFRKSTDPLHISPCDPIHLPVADMPPGQITQIEAFPGDTQITYRITDPAVSSLPITGYQISDDGTSGWSVITLDSDNDYVLTGLQNAVEVIRYFRASSGRSRRPTSPPNSDGISNKRTNLWAS